MLDVMKKLLIIFLIFLLATVILYSQTPDSTDINIKTGFNDKEIGLMSQILNLEKITLTFSDTAMIGKKFMLTQVEYIDGEKVSDKPFVKCGEESKTIVVGGDTIIYLLGDMCDKMKFRSEDSVLIIHFLCDNSKEDKARIIVRYPPIFFEIEIEKKVDENYSLRDVLACGSYSGKVPVNKKIPIIAYAPPFDMGGGAKGYCILNLKPVEEWHKYYKLKHYVVFYLEIKD